MSLALESCRADVSRATDAEAHILLSSLHGWQIDGQKLTKAYQFKNYYETMAFVNVAAWVSHRQDHHPELRVLYNTCHVAYDTHSVGGLSRNDFICAAKLDAMAE